MTDDLPNSHLKRPKYVTSLFSKSKTVALVISLPTGRLVMHVKLDTVVQVEEALGVKGRETMMRQLMHVGTDDLLPVTE